MSSIYGPETGQLDPDLRYDHRLSSHTSTLHRTSGNDPLGFLLTLAAVLLWGVLAISLKLLLVGGMDAYTITWYRMVISALLLGSFQASRGQLPSLGALAGWSWGLLALAFVGLVGNYVLFSVALSYIPPTTAQLVLQLAPILMLAGSLVIFRESFSRPQALGVAGLMIGLLLFFNDRLDALLHLSGVEAIGVAIVVVSSVLWASYALAQKQLLVALSSPNILLLIYVGAAVLLLPMATPSQVTTLGGFELGLLAFAIFNTLAAYGCFAEALQHWEASRVSAAISLTPLVTIVAVYAILAFWPSAQVGTRLDSLGLIGAALIVAGSTLTALWRPAAAIEPLDLE